MPILKEEQVNIAFDLLSRFLSAPRISDGTLATEEETQAERDRKRGGLIDGTLLPLVRNYLNGDIELSDFKFQIDGINKSNHDPWGFSGFNGQVFFNIISKKVTDKQEFDQMLKQVIAAPENEEIAANRIQTFVSYVKNLGDQIESAGGKKTGRPKQGSIPFFLSYFWQIQVREIWPVYYPSTTEVMTQLNFWKQSGDLGQDYLKYKHIYEELVQLFSKKTGKQLSLYDVEHVFWFYNKTNNNNEYDNQKKTKPIIERVERKSHLVLIGTLKNALDGFDRIKQAIAERGGWASWWSFVLKEDITSHLGTPFYLYLNIGQGKIPVRMQITEFSISQGNEGLQSPWPEITHADYIGKTRMGPEQNKIFKTWLKVSDIQHVNPPMSLSDFEPAVPWSNENNLINQNAFGYAYLKLDRKPQKMVFSKDEALKKLFMEEETLDAILNSLNRKKNIILQGPPGVGKTFAARILAYTFMEEKNNDRVQMVQFHQSYAYEDFVQGWRPKEAGGFERKNGVFYEFCKNAEIDGRPHVFIIDEINRGNLSKIFGELLMLIENDKRGQLYEIPLIYSKESKENKESREKFNVPENVYIIGLMNTADRSLAMVDYALRRRFTFFDLDPAFKSSKFTEFFRDKGASDQLIQKICDRINIVNSEIAKDHKDLGKGFVIGHSYFCPMGDEQLDDDWYKSIIYNEIKPLLQEYWSDDMEVVERLIGNLLK